MVRAYLNPRARHFTIITPVRADSKEKGETRIRIRWVLLKILLDAWQLFTTVITPAAQGWSIDPNGT